MGDECLFIATGHVCIGHRALINKNVALEERGSALGTVVGFSSFFMACGPFIGGFLADFLSWRWVFLINIPLAIVSISFILRAVPHDNPAHQNSRFDFPGFICFAISLSTLIIGLSSGSDSGWTSARTLALLGIAAVALICFAVIEVRSAHPKSAWPLWGL